MKLKISETMILTEEDSRQLERAFADSAFNLPNGSDYIACVGANGGYGVDTIFDGFASAVKTLIDSIGEYENTADPMVYPILYSIRHSIELFFKISYDRIFLIKKIKENRTLFTEIKKMALEIKSLEEEIRHHTLDEHRVHESQNKEIRAKIDEIKTELNSKCNKMLSNKSDNKTHNLKEIHDNIISICSVDERIENEFNFISKYFKVILTKEPDKKPDVDILDPDGDMFRYLTDSKRKPHFISNNIQHVDLKRVGEQFKWMKHFFEDFLQNLSYIRREYETATYTSKLSRKQIEEVSNLLPNPEKYKEKIKEVKAKVMKKYNLSSTDFDKVIKIIEAHPEFSLNYGKELILCEISPSTLNTLINCSISNSMRDSFKKIPIEEFYALLTYEELGRHMFEYFSEDYSCIHKQISECKQCVYSIHPIINVSRIIKGMRLCGQKTYADILENGLEKKSLQNQ